ncbi:hypothetical protein BO94DRAFT_27131 [Aspergillus sclerotioniger CBS 115572]|uniref:Uncharacterized protein n=1 Tax=Aspergillus sclerotioniger CBS 115572 TaxID=1450535 RepID=A0A317X1S6_9EURO|nr:hypothetical protein BO94DRAFT_27131 [Aspergillus sclerotioniger CBS 115572]PWY90500.1 hypothetical protein BO94DRAFT_27131 [Aspergillus sclerotioniger CBS 115572]
MVWLQSMDSILWGRIRQPASPDGMMIDECRQWQLHHISGGWYIVDSLRVGARCRENRPSLEEHIIAGKGDFDERNPCLCWEWRRLRLIPSDGNWGGGGRLGKMVGRILELQCRLCSPPMSCCGGVAFFDFTSWMDAYTSFVFTFSRGLPRRGDRLTSCAQKISFDGLRIGTTGKYD